MKLTRDDIGKEFITRSGRKAVLSNVGIPINVKLEDSVWGEYPYMFEIQHVGEDGIVTWHEETMKTNLSLYDGRGVVFGDCIIGEWMEPSVKFYHDDIIVIKSKYSNVAVRRHFHSKTDDGILCYDCGSSSITSDDVDQITLWEYTDYTFHKYEITNKF